MHKLLSLVLSVSILVGSVSPSLAQLGPIGRRGLGNFLRPGVEASVWKQALSAQVSAQVTRQIARNMVASNALQSRILAGDVNGLAGQILQKPVALRLPILRDEFVSLSLMPGAVTPAQRTQAVASYKKQLQEAKAILSKPFDLNSFLQAGKQVPNAKYAVAVRDVLADASALGVVGTRKDAPALLDFCEQAQGTQFEEVATLITAHGLLRMQAYEELQTVMTKYDKGGLLDGVKAYITNHEIPVTYVLVSQVNSSLGRTENKEMADFLSKDSFEYNRLHANFTEQAVEKWVNLEKYFLTPRTSAQNPTALPNTQVALAKSSISEKANVPAVTQEGASKRLNNIQTLFKRNEEFGRVTFPVEIMDVSGNMTKAPITFSIGGSLADREYDHVVFREDPNFENKYVIELHDHGKEPIQMGHFYMALYDNDVGPLVRAAQKAGVNLRLKLEHSADVNYETLSKTVYDEKTGQALPLEVSVQLGQALWAREMSQGFSHWLESVGLPASYVQNALTGAKIFLRTNGELGMQLAGSHEILPLPNEYYVRLPKHQVQNVVALLPQLEEGRAFNIVLSPTANRVNIVARDASLTSVSVGKTMGSVVHDSLGMGEADAKGLMMVVSYVMPGFASLMTPALKKYGEKNLLTLSMGMSVLAGGLATLGGFNGFVEGTDLNLMQKILFVGALFSLSGSGIIKQLVSNMLIRANRGEVVLTSQNKKTAKAVTQQEPAIEGTALLAKRFKEFFAKESGSLRDLVLYNKSFVYKNIGALTFLASPFLLKYGVLWSTGINLGIDYSISFPLYAIYSSYVMWKVLRSKLRDAYTAKNLLQSQQMLSNMLKTGTQALAEKGSKRAVIDDVARSFKDSLDALAFAHIKVNPSDKKKEFYQEAKEHILADLELNLVQKYAVPAPRSKQLVKQVAESIKVQENMMGNMLKMLKVPGVGALTTAMTLATVHEFVISTSFATTITDLINEGELANFLMATSLYVPMIIGRLGGNWISRRISPDTMYLLCSALSAVGTGIMAVAGTSVPAAITGAAIASLGVGNFFTQMYDYIMNRYPKHNRELSAILSLTMGIAGIAAIPAGYITAQHMGAPLDLWYAAASLAASLLLTPSMMVHSSLVQAAKCGWQNLKKRFNNLFTAKNLNNIPQPGGFVHPIGLQRKVPPAVQAPAH